MSLSNIFGGVLAGLGKGYEQVQDQKHTEKREDQKAQRDAAVKMMGDQDLAPSERAYWRKVWLKTHGIADEAKAPPQMTAVLDKYMGSGTPASTGDAPPKPSQMNEIGIPSEARPLERRAAEPPPSPEAAASVPSQDQSDRVPTREEYAQAVGIKLPVLSGHEDWNHYWDKGRFEQGYQAQLGRKENFQFRKELANDTAAARKAEKSNMPPAPAGIIQIDVPDDASPTKWSKVSINERTKEEHWRMPIAAPKVEGNPTGTMGEFIQRSKLSPEQQKQFDAYAERDANLKRVRPAGNGSDVENTPFKLWQAQNPGKPVSEFYKMETAGRSKEANKELAEARVISIEAELDRLAETANDLLNDPGIRGAVGFRIGTQRLPGTNAARFRGKLETLKSQIAFSTLQKMRETSKTGGALGQVSEKELLLLQNNLAALDPDIGEEEFKKSLRKIIENSTGAKARLRKTIDSDSPESAATAPPSPGGTPTTVQFGGKGYSFPNKQAADAFKKEVGIQ